MEILFTELFFLTLISVIVVSLLLHIIFAEDIAQAKAYIVCNSIRIYRWAEWNCTNVTRNWVVDLAATAWPMWWEYV